MTPDLARAERAQAVRDAARSWERAGEVEGTVAAAVAARYPDDRVRVGPVFRVLLFLFTLLAVGGFYSFVGLLADPRDADGWAWLALLAGLAMVAATEVQIGPLRRRQGGTEAATSFLAVGFLLGAVAVWLTEPLHDVPGTVALFCLNAAVLLAAAAWRWGYPLYAGAATARCSNS
jgi:O-antigen/teichoic acid export membrane protein